MLPSLPLYSGNMDKQGFAFNGQNTDRLIYWNLILLSKHLLSKEEAMDTTDKFTT